MAPHQPLIETLFQEMRGRIPEDDSSVPVKDGDWTYWWAFQPGAQYRTWYRRPAAGGAETVIFDEPREAEGKQYFRLGAMEVSPDGRYAAILVDDGIATVPADESVTDLQPGTSGPHKFPSAGCEYQAPAGAQKP